MTKKLVQIFHLAVWLLLIPTCGAVQAQISSLFPPVTPLQPLGSLTPTAVGGLPSAAPEQFPLMSVQSPVLPSAHLGSTDPALIGSTDVADVPSALETPWHLLAADTQAWRDGHTDPFQGGFGINARIRGLGTMYSQVHEHHDGHVLNTVTRGFGVHILDVTIVRTTDIQPLHHPGFARYGLEPPALLNWTEETRVELNFLALWFLLDKTFEAGEDFILPGRCPAIGGPPDTVDDSLPPHPCL